MNDTLLSLRSSTGNLTADEAGSFVNVGPLNVQSVVEIVVPAAGGTSPTLDVTISLSENGTDTLYTIAGSQITAAGVYYIPVPACHCKYIKAALDVGGTSPNFGAVTVYVVPAGRYDKP